MRLLVQPEEAPAAACTPIEDSRFGFLAQADHALYSSAVGELLSDSSWRIRHWQLYLLTTASYRIAQVNIQIALTIFIDIP